MTRLSRNVLGGLILMVLVAASCSSGDGSGGQGAIEVTDQVGRVVTLDKVPQRIVSLAPSNTEILFALDLEERIVGVSTYCDFPAEATEKATIGGFSSIDIERVVSLAPDLVVAVQMHEKEVIPELERYGLKVLALNPRTVSDVAQTIELVGRATGTEREARELVEEMESRMEAVASLVAELSAEAIPRVFYVVWHDPLMTAGRDTLQSQLISLAGGKNIFDDLPDYPTVDLEVLLDRQPQVIVAGAGHGSANDAPLEWARSEPRLRHTEALMQGMVFDIDADITSRAGPRVVNALEEMLYLIHPELAAKLKE